LISAGLDEDAGMSPPSRPENVQQQARYLRGLFEKRPDSGSRGADGRGVKAWMSLALARA
jgi:hypothetical protein